MSALVLIDVQNDFCDGGSLAVPGGTAVVPVCNALRRAHAWDKVVLTQDWHPADHASFAVNNPGAALFSTITLPHVGEQVMWPAHCVQGTPGAEFHPDLQRADGDLVVRKGTLRGIDSYSAFGDALDKKFERTPLAQELQAAGVKRVVVAGLALDYCVSFSAKDAAREGFKVTVVLPGCRGIAPDSIAREMDAMRALGVSFVEEGTTPEELGAAVRAALAA